MLASVVHYSYHIAGMLAGATSLTVVQLLSARVSIQTATEHV